MLHPMVDVYHVHITVSNVLILIIVHLVLLLITYQIVDVWYVVLLIALVVNQLVPVMYARYV